MIVYGDGQWLGTVAKLSCKLGLPERGHGKISILLMSTLGVRVVTETSMAVAEAAFRAWYCNRNDRCKKQEPPQAPLQESEAESTTAGTVREPYHSRGFRRDPWKGSLIAIPYIPNI